MNKSNRTKSIRLFTFSTITAISLLVTPMVVQAKAGDIVYRGIVTARPAGKVGTWVVGGRSFSATASTQLDTLDGPLKVGGCAKVKIRANAVKEIDSEPARNCR